MEQVRIQDDLFNHVNGEWIENAVIPNDRPVTGGFANLDKDVEELMIKEFKEMSKSGKYPNIYVQRAVEIFNMITNVSKRKRQGIKPALKTLKKIDSYH